MAILEKTRKILWGRSGNRCAICRTELVLEKDPYNFYLNIGEECHIISKQPNGPRHQILDNFDYDNSDNLILLCCNHHKIVDEQINVYPIDTIRAIKGEHEIWVKAHLDKGTNVDFENEGTEVSSLLDYIIVKHDIEMNIKSSKQTLESETGLKIAFEEAANIKSVVENFVFNLKEKAPHYNIQLRDNDFLICDIRFKGHTLLIQFYQAYANIVKDSYLLFGIIQGLFDDSGHPVDPFNMPKLLNFIRLEFSYNEGGEFGWRDKEDNKAFYLSNEITNIWLDKFFKYVLK